MSQYHIIEPKKLSNESAELLKADSLFNETALNTALKYLESDYISKINVLSLSQSGLIKYAGTSNISEITDYCKPGMLLWDIVNDIPIHQIFRVINDKNRTRIFMDYYFGSSKDIFIFNIDYVYISSIDKLDKIYLYKRLSSLVNYLYNNLTLDNEFKFISPECPMKLPITADYYSNYQQVLQCYHLTEAGLNILRYLSTGCSSKVIAKYLGLSFRTVESHIKVLIKRLGLQSKKEVEFIAQVIMQQLKYRQILSDLTSD